MNAVHIAATMREISTKKTDEARKFVGPPPGRIRSGDEWLLSQSSRLEPFRGMAAAGRGPSGRRVADYLPPATSLWNRGFLRSGSKLGSILSQPGER